MRSILRTSVIVLLPLLLAIACTTDDPASSDDDGRILLNRDLDGRITTFPDGVDLPVDDDAEWGSSVQVSSSRTAGRQTSFTDGVLVLMLRAEIDPPALDGLEMRATHVQVDGDRAYVTYNREGETFLGGVEVFDVSNASAPVLLSQALFTDTDVSAVYVYGDKLYLAEATSDESYTTPAILEVLELDGDGLLTTTSERVDLPSYVATGVRVAAQGESATVYVTSGTGGPVPGGLSIYDASTLGQIEMVELDDARDVDVEGDAVVVMQGTPGRLNVFDAATNTLQNSFTPGGANIAESKSTIDVVVDRIYMAAGDEGTKVVSLSSGEILHEIPASRLTVSILR